MLTSAHRIVHYDFADRRVAPDRLTRRRHAAYVRAAGRMIAAYGRGVGRARQDLHGHVERILEECPDCPPRRVAAFCKLLDDASEFAAGGTAAETLRRRVFTLAAEHHPLVLRAEGIFDKTVDQVRQAIATELGRTWEEIEAALFADVLELQRLLRPPEELAPADLLARYNVAQTQALLYRATQVRLWASSDLKTILRHAKLAGLMHTIRTTSPGAYEITLDGPTSALRMTTRYGIHFARLIPKLLACSHWRLRAKVLGPNRDLFTFTLSPADGLHSPLPAPDEYDSALEAEIFSRWEAAPPPGWRMRRESEILHNGQEILTPDFVLYRETDPKPIHIELVGYWTPEYLRAKADRLNRFRNHRWILLVPKGNLPSVGEIRLPVYPLSGKFKPEELVRLAESTFM